jgi:hypothetical protein
VNRASRITSPHPLSGEYRPGGVDRSTLRGLCLNIILIAFLDTPHSSAFWNSKVIFGAPAPVGGGSTPNCGSGVSKSLGKSRFASLIRSGKRWQNEVYSVN